MSSKPYLEEYKRFRGVVALHKVSIGKVSQKTWSYYDFGPKSVVPIICLPGVAGTCDVFFKQIEDLASKGYRVISIQHAPYMSFSSLLKGLDLLVERLKITKCHVLGEGLGGYIGQCYAQYRPAKVASLILVNSYCDLQHFVDSSPWTSLLSWMPDTLMKRFLTSDLSYKGTDKEQATASKFVTSYAKKLFDTDDLCSRLTLQYMEGPLKPTEFPVSNEAITILDTADPISFQDRIRLEVHKYYPGSREVTLESGGTFPFLTRPVEFNAQVVAHLNANGTFPEGTPSSLGQQLSTFATEASSSSASPPASASVSVAAQKLGSSLTPSNTISSPAMSTGKPSGLPPSSEVIASSPLSSSVESSSTASSSSSLSSSPTTIPNGSQPTGGSTSAK